VESGSHRLADEPEQRHRAGGVALGGLRPGTEARLGPAGSLGGLQLVYIAFEPLLVDLEVGRSHPVHVDRHLAVSDRPAIQNIERLGEALLQSGEIETGESVFALFGNGSVSDIVATAMLPTFPLTSASFDASTKSRKVILS